MDIWLVLEWTAVVSGIVCVWLAAKEKIWTWPIGIVSVIIFLLIFFRAKLYSDMALQGFFLVSGFYGWYQWLYGNKMRDELPITTSTWKDWIIYLVISIASILLIGYFFDTYTDADLAYWDAYTTAFSLIAQILMARKKLVNWLFWIGVDVIAIGIYLYKGLYPTTFLYVIYLGLAIYGYINWLQLFKLQVSPAQQLIKE